MNQTDNTETAIKKPEKWNYDTLGHMNKVRTQNPNSLTFSSVVASDGYIYKSGQRHPDLTYIFNFWHSGTLALRAERQSARMSEIKNGRLSLYGSV